MTTPADRLTPDRAARLALVRVLLDRGREAIRDPAPFGALGLLPLHDAVETFLHIAGEAVGAAFPPRPQFSDYFKLIDAQLPSETPLAERIAMARFNLARVNLKHHGLRPDPGELAGHGDAVDRFFAHAVPLVFGRELAAISLVALVRDADVRKELEDAERHLAAGQLTEALAAAAVAAARSLVRAGVTGPGDVRPPSFTKGVQAEVAQALGELAAAITVQTIGIDLAAYHAFRTITPTVAFARAGNAQIRWTGPTYPERDQVEAAVEFATNLVLRVEDAMTGVERTYERFGVVRWGNSLIIRQRAAAAAGSQQPPAEEPPASGSS